MLTGHIRRVCAGAALLLSMGCGAGNVAFRAGRKAELRKDYDTALVNYEKAVQSEPENAKFIIRERTARTQASLFHMKQGRRLIAENRPDEGAGEFQKAVGIDPSNEAAAQELARLLTAQAAAKRARESTIQQALKAREEPAAPARVQLKPFPTEPLAHFRISADSRKVFETLAKLAELNAAFTADFQSKPVSVDLTNVKLEDALRVVCFQTKTFWRAITPNTLLVIMDTPANRRDYEEEVLKTVYLSNPLAPADRTAITTALKQVLGLQRIVDNPDSNAIIIRDTPSKVADAERLIRGLDRGKAEVLVEVAVVEADRNRIRDLGLSLGPLSVPGVSLPTGSQVALGFTPPSTGTTTSVGLPLNRLGKLSTSDFSIALPGAVATALLNDARTHVLQNPQIRVTDGQTAKLRIGSRVPYATGSFGFPGGVGVGGGGTAGGGFGFLANTQFQYQEVGVNLDITPRLMANGEVALHALIEISSLQAPISVGGFSQPTFGQRKIEHDIRLKEGEVNLLGGLILSTEVQTVTGLPGLGQIPFLRYLFSSEHRERVETEVLVMLTPRVIRLPELAAESARDLVLGTETRAPMPEAGAPPQVVPEPPGTPQ